MATLGEIRMAVLQYEGGHLGGYYGTVDADPDILDPDGARSLISSKLYDGEKLSNAYGGHYFWIPKYSDNRRAETRGYRVRFSTVFEPPRTGTYTLSFYGYGSTIEIPSGTFSDSLEQAIREVHPDLGSAEVFDNADGTLEIQLLQRIGMGSSSGRLRSNGGLGVIVMNRDFSQPLRKGTQWWASPSIPFETADGITGINVCINDALYDIMEDDLIPIESIGIPGQTRDRVVHLFSLYPWLQPEMIVGYYAPTEWESVITFYPPKAGTYQVSLQTSVPYGPNVTPLPYNASGAALESALRSISAVPQNAANGQVVVSPQGVASVYTITWRTQHHRATIVPTKGVVARVDSRRLRDPYVSSLLPFFRKDSNEPTLGDPGYEEGVSWFVGVRRRAITRICPQTYPLKADGTLDTDADPILGTEWIDSTNGLVNDLDQTFVPISRVVAPAFRYCLASIAASAQGGDQARWESKGHEAAVVAAAGLVYGPIQPRGNRAGRGGPGWPPLGNKAAGFFAPEY